MHFTRTWLPLLLAAGCTSSPLEGDLGDPADPADPVEPGVPGEGEDGGGDDEELPPATPISFACPDGAAAIVSGANTLEVGGRTRRFIVDLPADPDRALGVVFSWHGFLDNAAAFRNAAALDPDANPARPVVVITPDDTDLLPPFGLGWDIGYVTTNVDLSLFEAVLGCLAAQYTIDSSAIYSFGFSAGSVMTNLIHATYPDLVTTIVSESGAWFNDPVQIDLVGGPLPVPIAWNWPALDPADGGTVIMTHGGPNDVTVANVLNLEAAAQATLPFLATGGRVVYDCPHTGGHVFDPSVTPNVVALLTGSATMPPSCAKRMP